ncbi:MAG: VWA domain-containing protein [Clostridiales bacterium]|nr:VWA domain-containing protein [Clostridiales bacterium]MCF8021345.1 VWA domain-containing protein [Clostridiales bacterium]
MECSMFTSKNNDYKEVVQQHLVTFTEVLRALGVRVSTVEVLDAVKALSVIDIACRDQFKSVLAAVMVKKVSDRQLFELAFENYFVPEEKKLKSQQADEIQQEQVLRAENKVENEIQESIQRSGGGQWAGGVEDYLQVSKEQKETLAQMDAGDRERLYQTIEGFEGNPVNDPSQVIANVIEASLNYWRYYMMKQEDAEESFQKKNLNVEYTGRKEVDQTVSSTLDQYSQKQEESLLYKDMQSIAEEELTRVTAIVNKLSSKLANRISRRYKISNASNKIDIRKTIRKNINYGGLPVHLVYKSRRLNRPKMVMLCDVSASMTRYARFIIQFVYGLADVIKDVEIFIFSENTERITPYFSSNEGFSRIMFRIMSGSEQWGKTTNLNAALDGLETQYKHIFNSDTYFFIMSDTKTQQSEQAARKVSYIREKAKDLIWLNTLPEKEWPNIFTVELFSDKSTMLECGTLAQLEDILVKHLL